MQVGDTWQQKRLCVCRLALLGMRSSCEHARAFSRSSDRLQLDQRLVQERSNPHSP